MTQNEDNRVLPFLISPLIEPRGQIDFCQNLIENLIEKGESPCTKEFAEVNIKR